MSKDLVVAANAPLITKSLAVTFTSPVPTLIAKSPLPDVCIVPPVPVEIGLRS